MRKSIYELLDVALRLLLKGFFLKCCHALEVPRKARPRARVITAGVAQPASRSVTSASSYPVVTHALHALHSSLFTDS